MNSLYGSVCLLIGIMVGPFAIITFIPGGSSLQLQPMLMFGGACYGGGCLAAILVMMGSVMTKDEIDKSIKKEKEDARK